MSVGASEGNVSFKGFIRGSRPRLGLQRGGQWSGSKVTVKVSADSSMIDDSSSSLNPKKRPYCRNEGWWSNRRCVVAGI